MRKKIAVTLAVMMLFLGGCNREIKITTGLSRDEIFKISGEIRPLAEMTLVLVNEKNKYEEYLGKEIWDRTFDDISLENEIKDKVKNQVIELSAIHLMAEKDGIKLNDSEKETLQQAADAYFSGLSDEEKETLNVTEENVYHLYEEMYLTDKYYEAKTGGGEKEISDEDARVIQVMYIYFKTGDRDIHGTVTPYEESVLKEIQSRAESVLARVNQGGDFQSLAAAESDDSEYKCTFGRGTMDENFEKAAFSLADGENSDLVQTEGGYYIIKCVDDYLERETEENKQAMKEKYKSEAFKEIYQPFLEKQNVEFNNKVWDKISVSEYESCTDGSLYEVYYSYFK